MHVLCCYIDQESGVILPRFTPSLRELARDSGLHRRTIMRYLNGLEGLAWVTRRRPSPHDARTRQARTNYLIHIGQNLPQPSDSQPPDLGTQDPGSRDSMPSDLGTASLGSRGSVTPKSSMSSKSSREEISAVIEAIKARAGITVSEEWADRVAGQVLGARDRVRDPVAVLRAVIGKAPRDTYAPTPQPPRFTKEKGFQP